MAYVIFPGGFGTMDEFFESLTLIQTTKIRRFPIVLFGASYWQGLLDWMRAEMLPHGCIAAGDLDLFHLAETPQAVADIIGCHQEQCRQFPNEQRRATP
jgi:predicted Rossmann-fold nucleotide-binding protein